jgi:hypothetical protein
MSVKSLISDPDFAKLSPEQQQAAVAAIDPAFKSLNQTQFSQAVQGIKGQSPIPLTNNQTPLEQLGTDLKNSNGFFGTANMLLKAPEKMSKQGLDMIANATPETVGGPMTGNLPLDLLKGTPKVLAETAAQVAPGFVSKGAILTAGAMQGLKAATPLIKMAARGTGSQLESLSGAAPGMTKAAAEAPLLNPIQLQHGRKAASAIYEAGKEIGGGISPEFTQESDKLQFVKKAVEKAARGELTPEEALEARKELDRIKKTVPGIFYRTNKAVLEPISDQVFASADEAHRAGIMAESSRQIMPQNKYGGTSAFKTGIITALQAIKREGGLPGKVIGTAGQLAMSPAAVGAAATVAGDAAAAAKPFVNNPIVAGQAVQLAKRVATGQLPSPILPLPPAEKEAKPLPNPVIPADVAPAIEKMIVPKKALTQEKIKQYLKDNNNDKAKARAAAIRDGYDPTLPFQQ